ncbi:hypothetical protein BofuT4_P091450.1 [Botrytis cinerea T4]|uniref:Uncharacterized protein n=1 Tax=Botryotinia fuckeliana (strain T4) TaxID=999810 RepID=G2YF65_BOTF4|nr:hypothetical protein BofuT4_P091450.1 [Botrytis cinerea T4]
MALETPHWAAPRVSPRSLSQNTIELLGEVKHNDELREVEHSSSILSSLANPVPVSSRKNNEPQEIGRSSKVIIDGSCLVESAPSYDKAKAKFDELGKSFPSDLPYIITYEGESLGAICQEFRCRLLIGGSALGGIMNHANSKLHGFNVEKRLHGNNLEEISTSRVRARRKAMHNPSKPGPFKKVQNEKPRESSSAEDERAEASEHSEPEPRKSKRRKLAPAFLAKTDTSDLQTNITCLKTSVDRPRRSENKETKRSDVACECRLNWAEKLLWKKARYSRANFGESETSTRSVTSKLNEQKELVDSLSSRMESGLKGQKETTMNLSEVIENSLKGQNRRIDHLMKELKNLEDSRKSEDLLQLHTKNELQTSQVQIAYLEQKISEIQHDANKKVSEIIEKQISSHISLDRIVKVEKSIERLTKILEDPFPANTFEAIVDRLVSYTAENHNRLKEMVKESDERHLNQRASLIEGLETKISCTSQAAIHRVANLEGSLKEFQTKLAGMASLAVDPQLQCCKQYSKLLEKQAVEFRPYVNRIIQLEENVSNSRSLKDRFDSLKTCTQGFQKWLDEMAWESAEHRLQQDNLRTEFLERQALESQTFMGRIKNLEKNTMNMTRLVEKNKVSGESIREHMSKFQSTSDQVTQLKKEVQSYENKLGSVAVALDNRRLQQLKEHTELIKEKISHIRTDSNNMITKCAANLSDMAVQAARAEIIRENSSREHQIDDLVQSIRPIMLRLADLESTERQSDDMMMIRLAAFEEKSER